MAMNFKGADINDLRTWFVPERLIELVVRADRKMNAKMGAA